jgi:hypothetical protein
MDIFTFGKGILSTGRTSSQFGRANYLSEVAFFYGGMIFHILEEQLHLWERQLYDIVYQHITFSKATPRK